MPMFEYQCKSCLREFEELVFGDELPTCPHCHSANTEKLLSRPCACRREGGDSGGGCSGCSGGSCASCGH
ncbi:MAG TPA: zinc ribbon domain-containing protein [Candidatus Mailhella merdigallinarum]|uniref:Zinc ribbon domain-containing protein n=1 Tax=Candidatus Mailhella merdigallinarum TaxID=2838658 RepID=A0A9D2KKX6_9BACT|nr:MAG: FmdB family transcriptional regulator [Desulfovibrionaceae bacterium]HJA09344.1 zinc ribbon domain-containing protein [Candidatus Mailhella merdigallinarum]